MMKKTFSVLLGMGLLLTLISIAFAADKGTPAQAEAMVKKAVAYYKTNGSTKAFAEFSNPKGQFVNSDLYVFVYDLNGKCVAHGANQKMIGLDLIAMKDPDGKAYVKERVEIAKTKGKGWQDYKFTNPVSKQIEQKTAYLEKVDEYIIGCGAYK
jgi:cytochrome c